MLSKTFAYALRGLAFIALHGSEERKVGTQELAKGIDVSSFFLGKIMQQLVKKKVVCSAKGPGGGFWLDEKALKKTAFEILKIVDTKVVSSNCLMGKKNCSHERPCPLHFEYLESRDRLFQALNKITLNDLAGKVKAGEIYLNEKK